MNAQNNRDEYGALRQVPAAASALIQQAVAKGKIPAAFDSMKWVRINSRIGNKRIGEALHHEVYDCTADGAAALVCLRSVEGTKYGQKTTEKRYVIMRKHGRGIRVTDAPKAVAAKAAKATNKLGEALEICTGNRKLALPVMQPRIGVKIVRRNAAGALVSVYDESEWTIGKTRIEASTDDHTGGFYYYRNEAEAIAAARRNDLFPASCDVSALVLIEVEASGVEHTIGAAKLCASRLRPTRILGDVAL